MYSGKYRIFPQHLVSVAQTAVHKEKSIIGRTVKISLRHRQGYANPRRQVSLTDKLCTAMPKICGSSVKKTCLMSPFWYLEFGDGFKTYWKTLAIQEV